jgi:hypothetical protein
VVVYSPSLSVPLYYQVLERCEIVRITWSPYTPVRTVPGCGVGNPGGYLPGIGIARSIYLGVSYNDRWVPNLSPCSKLSDECVDRTRSIGCNAPAVSAGGSGPQSFRHIGAVVVVDAPTQVSILHFLPFWPINEIPYSTRRIFLPAPVTRSSSVCSVSAFGECPPPAVQQDRSSDSPPRCRKRSSSYRNITFMEHLL